ncbi:MAG: hypothetical protein JNL92_15155 [Opitutaceae bacterium]|nr:hypothetical protein [Opitutaceae bacterium]
MSIIPKFFPATVSAIVLLASSSLFAGPIVAGINNITNSGGVLVLDLNKNAAVGANSVASHLTWLTAQVTGFNAIAPFSSLPAPTGGTDLGSAFTGNVNVAGYTYATLHYGGGQGGGGVVAYYLNGISSFDFPNNGLGPNGDGGLSTVYLFGPTNNRVPEGGSALALLGAGMALVAFIRRRLS